MMALSRQLRAGEVIASTNAERLAERALQVEPGGALWQNVARDLLALDLSRADAAAIDALAARVAPEAAKGLVPQTPLARPPAAIERAWERAGRR